MDRGQGFLLVDGIPFHDLDHKLCPQFPTQKGQLEDVFRQPVVSADKVNNSAFKINPLYHRYALVSASILWNKKSEKYFQCLHLGISSNKFPPTICVKVNYT